MTTIGQAIQGGLSAIQAVADKASAAPSADRDVVKNAFAAHHKTNPRMEFTRAYKSVTATNGKPASDKGWEQYTYDVKKVGRNEYLLRYQRVHYDRRYANINYEKDESCYYAVKVARNSDGTQRYRVTKYKGFYRHKLAAFSFTDNTKAGRALLPSKPVNKTEKAVASKPQTASFNVRRRHCTVLNTDYIRGTFLPKSIVSRSYKAATQARDGTVYRIRATYEAGARKYFITHSKKGNAAWQRHGRRKPPSDDAVKAFFHACDNYLVRQ